MNTYSLESFINFCDDMQIAEEKGLFGNIFSRNNFIELNKNIASGKKKFDFITKINGHEITVKYNNSKLLNDKDLDNLILIISCMLTEQRLMAINIIINEYEEKIQKNPIKVFKLSKNIFIKEIKIIGNGPNINLEITVRDNNRNKNIVFGNSQISTYVNNTSLQNLLVNQINLQNQLNTQNIINQQQQMVVNDAMNASINASLNASAMSMGMPPGSFGMF